MLRHQEDHFVEQLAARVPDGARLRFDRDDVSVLMTALRCGTDLEVLLTVAPKVNVVRIYAAYRRLELLRRTSVEAWKAIEASPAERTIFEQVEAAKVLLPVPVSRVLYRLGQGVHDDVVRAVAETAAEMRKTEILAHSIEADLGELAAGDASGVTAGTKLYDPHHPGVYASPFYCPDRVSALTPLRLRDLLNERS